jgi:predicted transposase YbfD/YdcC
LPNHATGSVLEQLAMDSTTNEHKVA